MHGNFIFRFSLAVVCSLFFASTLFAARNVRDDDTVPLPGNVPNFARAGGDLGLTDRNLLFERMVLVLTVRPDAKIDLQRFLAQQQDPSSPDYHRWLTPDQFGQRFGWSDSDLADVTAWLTRNGMHVDAIGRGRGWINFTGKITDVERMFHTSIHDYRVDGRTLHANASDPQIPRALTDIVRSVASLNNRFSHPEHHLVPRPQFGTGPHYVAPADFATIYNTAPLYTSHIDGTGQAIAVVGRSDIFLSDVQSFRSTFGLPANDPVFIHNGPAPGTNDDETEADLDVEWAGAVAPKATIDFVISASTATSDGVDLSAQYIVDNDLAPVMTVSYGLCEALMDSGQLAFYNTMWGQAAAQGITVFVSSGDSGVAGCDVSGATSGSGAGVSGLCSTPYNVCVGGTEFLDSSNPSAYWSSGGSALGYIPEAAWNESGAVGGSGLLGTGGGPSSVYAKPSWQACPGVPLDGRRDTPDVSLTAALHDGYVIYQGGLEAVGGTSASAPSMAGIMALVVQKTGSRQGNANPALYHLANTQYTGGAAVFHDITTGNNSVPGVTGYSCTTAYDLATGVGSVNGSALVNAWSAAAADFFIAAKPNGSTLTQGSSETMTVRTTAFGGFNSSISLSTSGVPSGLTVGVSPGSIGAPGNGTSTLTVTASASALGAYSFTLTSSGGGITHSIPISVTVAPGAATNNIVVDGGFEAATATGNSAPGWFVNPSPGHTIIIKNGSFPHTGTNYAFLGADSTDSTDQIYQQITIPPSATAASLSFYANVVTQETLGGGAFDYLYVNVFDQGGGYIDTLAILSNEDAISSSNSNGVYFKVGPIDVTFLKGQTIYLLFEADTDFSLATTFRVDDISLSTTTSLDHPPSTSITSPANGATLSGTAIVSATASDDFGLAELEIEIDGVVRASTNTSTSLSYSWNTTGAANGTHTIVSRARDTMGQVTTSAAVTVTVSNVHPAIRDFNHDGKSDVFWRNPSTGETSPWLMNGIAFVGTRTTTVTDLNWIPVAFGDFNGDGKADIFWWRKTTGDTGIWYMNGGAVLSYANPITISDTNWQVQGAGDFDGDGKTDIFWRNVATGETSVWLMNGASFVGTRTITVSDLNWKPVAFGDFDGDGKADIFWQNQATGETSIWLMNGGAVGTGARSMTVSDTRWKVMGAGDFDGDGKADLFWRNSVTGETGVWLMNGTSIKSSFATTTVSDLNWSPMTFGDFDGDGQTDILWWNKSTGLTSAWFMSGGIPVSGLVIATINTQWQPVSTR